ncbi:MAG: hypothetical protein C0504_08860 [Candidatus Solibacter sp.]|nr:hypothetical protein [Candidatus Solibacter sp.]
MHTFIKTLMICAALSAPGSAATLTWSAALTGSQELPPNVSTATGYGWVQFDGSTNVLSASVNWQGLTGSAVQSHIHCCVASPPGNVGIAIDLWLAASPQPASGAFSNSWDLDLVNPFRAAFVTANGGTVPGALAALLAAMDSNQGRAYFNIHTAAYPGGEIRGDISQVPEPATLLSVIGGLGLLLLRRRTAMIARARKSDA